MYLIEAKAEGQTAYVGKTGSAGTMERAIPFDTAEEAIKMCDAMSERCKKGFSEQGPAVRALPSRIRAIAPLVVFSVIQV